MSPIRITATVEEIFKRRIIETGMDINGIKLNNLKFADDIIQLAESDNDLKTTKKKK